MSIPRPRDIKPKVSGKADFFSWRLYQFALKKGEQSMQVFRSTWNPITGHDPDREGLLYIGRRFDDGWFHGKDLRSVCAPFGPITQCWAYGPSHGIEEWRDVTEEFWADYLKRGVCAIHGDRAHKWGQDEDESDERTCLYCGKQEKKRIVMVPREIWEAA